jgi:hypothetical protein
MSKRPLTTATQTGKPAQAPNAPDPTDGGAIPVDARTIKHRKGDGTYKPAPRHKKP